MVDLGLIIETVVSGRGRVNSGTHLDGVIRLLQAVEAGELEIDDERAALMVSYLQGVVDSAGLQAGWRNSSKSGVSADGT